MTAPTVRLGGSNKLISARELSERLGISRDSLYDNWRTWGLPGYYIGKHLRFREREVDAWLEKQAA